MKKRKILAALAVMGLLCGCSTRPKGRFGLSQRRVTIRTEPAGARVTQLRPLKQGPVDLGVTPLVNRSVLVLTNLTMKNMPFNETQKLLEHANNVVVLIEKDGYEAYRGTFMTKANEIMEHSIKLTPKSKNE